MVTATSPICELCQYVSVDIHDVSLYIPSDLLQRKIKLNYYQ